MKNNAGKFRLDFPIPRTLCGIMMGNGNFGAMVWGKDKLHITVNRSDFWDHRGGELVIAENFYKEAIEVAKRSNEELMDFHAALHKPTPPHIRKPQRIPVGRFEYSFIDGVSPVYAELDYISGKVTIKLSDDSDVIINMSVTENCLFIDDPYEKISDFAIKPSWEFEKSREWLSTLAFVEPDRIEKSDIKGWAQSCPADDPSLASICVKTEGRYIVVLEFGEDNDKAFSAAKIRVKSLNVIDLIRSAEVWWKDYWKDISEINIPDEFFSKFYKYALYKFAGATNPNGYACALQGPWHEEYQETQWCGDYHVNVNIQQIYTLAFSIGRFEHLMPLFNMIDSEVFTNSLRTNAKSLFNIEDGLWITHAVDDRGFQVGGMGPGAVIDPACSAWIAQLYWLYYKYKGDKEFLEKRAFPFMKGVMSCLEEMLEEEDGKFVVPLAISAEYASSNPGKTDYAGKNPSNQLYAIHMMVDYLIEASEVLGLEPKQIWLEIKKKLPIFTVIDGRDDRGREEKHIAIWEGQDLETCHRHHSHLACIYPFDTLPENLSEEDNEILENTIDHWVAKGFGLWSEWCIPWAAIIHSRLGFNNAPYTLLNMWKDIYINEGMTTNYLPKTRGLVVHRRHDMNKPKETNEVMQLDGTMGGATALLEMFAQQRRSTVYLFQGIPDVWADVSFKNIWLPGGFKASAEKKNGRIINVLIEATRKNKIKLGFSGEKEMILVRGETKCKVEFPLEIDCVAGELIELKNVN